MLRRCVSLPPRRLFPRVSSMMANVVACTCGETTGATDSPRQGCKVPEVQCQSVGAYSPSGSNTARRIVPTLSDGV